MLSNNSPDVLIDRKRLRARRKELELRQVDLAERVGVHEQTIRYIELGKSDNLGVIALMCDVLGLSYSEIVRDDRAVAEDNAAYFDAYKKRWELLLHDIPRDKLDFIIELIKLVVENL